MASVFDVAQYILEQQGEMTAMKLQKLVYYSQAWSLVWDEAPMFADHIEAWANGPVCPTLYAWHRGAFKVSSIEDGQSARLTDEQRDTVKAVLATYGDKSSQWLSDLTHRESPWQNARRGLASGERGSVAITTSAMHEYYDAL